MAWGNKKSARGAFAPAQRFVAKGKPLDLPPAEPLGAEVTDVKKSPMLGPKSKQQRRAGKVEPKMSSFRPKGF